MVVYFDIVHKLVLCLILNVDGLVKLYVKFFILIFNF